MINMDATEPARAEALPPEEPPQLTEADREYLAGPDAPMVRLDPQHCYPLT